MRRTHDVLRFFFCATAGSLVANLMIAPIPALAAEPVVNDKNVCNAVEDALFFDEGVSFDRIDIACADGIVTLSGTVNNCLAKRRAERLAETIKGVRAIVNRITVKPTSQRSPEEIERNVKAALLADAATDSYQVGVAATPNGVVRLTGTTESWREKQLAEKVAAGVAGVTDVENAIDVDYKTERSDQEIKAEVARTLEWNALVDSTIIDVAVDNGIVRLTGTVGSAAEKRQARYDAWVAGVRKVDDSGLVVRDWAENPNRRETAFVAKSPEDIRQAVRDAILYDPRVTSGDVSPQVSGSIVTLRGVVDSLIAKRAAAQDARNTTGVSRVLNRLKVRPSAHRKPQSDKQIADAVREALLRDPYVDRFDLSADVINGTLYLSGNVDSFFEKAQAENAASHVKGVTDISNALVVTRTGLPVIDNPYVYEWYVYDFGWYDTPERMNRKSDREIKEDIEDTLWWMTMIDPERVSVDVTNGVATLTGTVTSWPARRQATEAALRSGAVFVDNELLLPRK
ncbi:MAG: BON domain-containing protein [Phycisphaerae bacterium]|nr:BON domain-containing protein [Phycisphaerae bacterium]